MYKSICIIPARGGSKRLAGKNVRNLDGKPVIAHSIELAYRSGLFDAVYVSTDSQDIADIALQYGAKIPFFRSDINSDDHATLSDVLFEKLVRLKTEGVEPVYVCCLLPIAPLLQPQILESALQVLVEGDVALVTPVVRFEYPVQRAKVLRNGKMNFVWPEHRLSRSQDLEAFYHDAGAFYWLKVGSFLRDREVLYGPSGFVILPDIWAQDVDSEEDWKLLEIKYQFLKSQIKN